MPKATVSLLPPRKKTVEAVSFRLPGHDAEMTIHLRVPTHPELMRVLEERDTRAEEWCGAGKHWFPSATGQPFPVTRTILAVAMLILHQQCAPDGSALAAEDSYTDAELIDLCGSSFEFLSPFLDKFNGYLSVLEPDPKNSSAGGADS